MGILFGLASAIFWGLGDYWIAQLTRRIGTGRAMALIQTLSLLIWLAVLALRFDRPGGNGALWALAVATGVCHVLGLVFVYRAFEIGKLSLVSPISSSFAIVTAILALAMGERPPTLALTGAVLLVVGIVFATRSTSSSPSFGFTIAGIPEALMSALGFGTMFWLFYFFVQPELGYVWPLIILKTMATGSSILARASLAKTSPPPAAVRPANIWLLAAAAAGADSLAWLSYIFGMGTMHATIVTALASLFSVVTILLAWIFMRERLAIHQWSGVAIVLLGVVLVSI